MSKLLLLAVPGLGLLAVWNLAAAEEALPSPSVLIVPGIIILILVALNGFFVAAEFAIIGTRPTQLEQMAEEGSKVARRVLKIVESRRLQDRYIATAQLGITLASLGLAMYAEPQIDHFLAPYLDTLPFTISETAVSTVSYTTALTLLTYLHVVLGEMIPKSLALVDASTVVIWLERPMAIAQTVLGYPVTILNGVGNLLLQIFRVPPAEGHARVLSAEELELIVSESAEGGLLKEDEEEIIHNIFDFGDRIVAQVMTPRPKVQAIPNTMPKEEILKLITNSRHSRFPVYEGDLDHIIGILHLKDLVRVIIKKESRFDLRLITRLAPAVPEDYPIQTLLAAFKRQRNHMAIVLDEFGGMAGIVTLEDLVEEVVGEVRDEFDQEREPYIEISPGEIEVDGTFLVDELKELVYLGEENSLPDVETVGGLVVAKLGRLPIVGDSVIYNGDVVMAVLAVDRRAVSRVHIEFPDPDRARGSREKEEEE